MAKETAYSVIHDPAEFGRALIVQGDLDPIYEMLYYAQLPPDMLRRFCLAYWWFYNAGTAAYIAGASDFYRAAFWAFDNKWARGAERRHFRTAQARQSLEWFQHQFPFPEVAVDWAALKEKGYRTFKEVKSRVSSFPMFGPWVTFKVADMVDRCLMMPVDFSECELDMYEEPRKGAEIVARKWSMEDAPLEQVVEACRARLSEMTARISSGAGCEHERRNDYQTASFHDQLIDRRIYAPLRNPLENPKFSPDP